MWYTGDLNPGNVLRGRFHVSQGGFFRHNINSRFAWRAQFMKGTIEAHDADHPNAWQQERNLMVINEVMEYSVMAELNYRDYVVGVPRRRLMPFMMAGVAVFTHDPSALDDFGNIELLGRARDVPDLRDSYEILKLSKIDPRLLRHWMTRRLCRRRALSRRS